MSKIPIQIIVQSNSKNEKPITTNYSYATMHPHIFTPVDFQGVGATVYDTKDQLAALNTLLNLLQGTEKIGQLIIFVGGRDGINKLAYAIGKEKNIPMRFVRTKKSGYVASVSPIVAARQLTKKKPPVESSST